MKYEYAREEFADMRRERPPLPPAARAKIAEAWMKAVASGKRTKPMPLSVALMIQEQAEAANK
jgi:hypothetical protein